MNLIDKVAVVTGASGAIGSAVCKQLEEQGVTVHQLSRSTGVDARDEVAVKEFFAGIDGPIDILVTCVGSVEQLPESLEHISADEYRDIMMTNLDSVFHAMHTVLPRMKEQNSGVICNVSSRAALSAHPNLPIYSAAKAAANSLTHAVGKNLAEANSAVRCFAVLPGGVNSPMRQKLFGDAEHQQSPEQVAAAILNLLQDETVTGGLGWEIVAGETRKAQ